MILEIEKGHNGKEYVVMAMDDNILKVVEVNDLSDDFFKSELIKTRDGLFNMEWDMVIIDALVENLKKIYGVLQARIDMKSCILN